MRCFDLNTGADIYQVNILARELYCCVLSECAMSPKFASWFCKDLDRLSLTEHRLHLPMNVLSCQLYFH